MRSVISKVILGGLIGGLFTAQAADPAFWSWAKTPPMGWNSWDAFGSSVKEEQVLVNADYMDKHLKSHGWNLVTIDIQWYEPTAQADRYRRGAILEMDAHGRLLPASNRFPMTKDTHSFRPIADYLHAKGLKFGLHLMRGIPRQAVDNTNGTPILGTSYKAADIVNKANSCFWNTDMYGVDMSKPGAQEYYDSVYALMASWDLDFVKVDDLAGKRPEIEAIRKAIDKCGRPIVLSVSMGSQASQGEHLQTNAAPVIDPAATLPATISVALADIGLSGPCKMRDLWAHKDLDAVDTAISATINSHGAVLYRVSPAR